MNTMMPNQIYSLSQSTEKLNEDEAEKQFPINEIRRNILCEFNQNLSVPDEKLKVYLRVRPFTEEEIKKGEARMSCFTFEVESVASVIATAPEESVAFKNKPKNKSEKFTFSTIFPPDVDQHTLFNTAVLKYVANFVNGTNALIFSYGVTSSGKTFTIQGTPERVGVLPRALDVLFNTIQCKQQTMPYRFKPKNFDEIEVLDEAGLDLVLKEKEKVFRMAINEEDSRMLARSSTTCNTDFAFGECDSRASSTVESACGVSASCDATAAMASIMTATASRVREATRVFFEGLAANCNTKFMVWVSYYEIYNENVYDLLQPIEQSRSTRYAPQACIVKGRPALTLREDMRGAIFVRNLTCVPVVSADEAYRVMLVGKRNQHVAATQLNHHSSRSHGIFVVRLVRENCDAVQTQVTVSQLFLCDLAGSERTTKTQSTGLRLQEASRINSSLFSLGQCIDTLRHNQNHPRQARPVPYRNSKLTRVFQSFFTGKGRVAMIVNMNQCASFYDETLQVLKFSALAKAIVLPCEMPPVAQIVNSAARCSSKNKRRRSSRFEKLGLRSPRPGQRITIAWESPSGGSDGSTCVEQDDMDDSHQNDKTLLNASLTCSFKKRKFLNVDPKDMDVFFGVTSECDEKSVMVTESGDESFVSVVPIGSQARLSELATNFGKEELLFIVENLRDQLKEKEQEVREMASRIEAQVRKELCDEFDSQMRDLEHNFEQRMLEQERLLEDESERRIKLYMNYAEEKNNRNIKKLQQQQHGGAEKENELLCVERQRLREAQDRLALLNAQLVDAKSEASDFAASNERAVLQCEALAARLRCVEEQLVAARQELAQGGAQMSSSEQELKQIRYRDSSVRISLSRYIGSGGEKAGVGISVDETSPVPQISTLMAELHARQQHLNRLNRVSSTSTSSLDERSCFSVRHKKELEIQELRSALTQLEERFSAKHDALNSEQHERERVAAELEFLHAKLVTSEQEKAACKRAADAAIEMEAKLRDELARLRDSVVSQVDFHQQSVPFLKLENHKFDLPRKRALRKRKQ